MFVHSKPFAAAASKQLFRAIFLVLSAYFFFRASVSTFGMEENGNSIINSFRFRVLRVRNSSLPSDVASISSVGLLRDGCPLISVGTELETYQINMLQATRINGYFFVTDNMSTQLDPVRWVAEAHLSNSSDWIAIGASVWINLFVGLGLENPGPQLYPWISYPTPINRGFQVNLDMRPSWPQILVGLTWGYEWAACFLFAACASMVHRENLVKIFFMVAMALDVFFLSAAAVGSTTNGDSLEALGTFLYLPPQVCLQDLCSKTNQAQNFIKFLCRSCF